MKNLLLIILCLCFLLLYSCNKKLSDRQTAGLKGNILSLREISYQAFGNQDTLVKGEIVMSEDIQNYYVTYNQAGNITNMYTYDNTNALIFHWRYTYDKNNQTLSAILIDKDNEILDSTYYVYDSKGNNKEYYHYDSQGKLTYKLLEKHDRKGNCTQQKLIDSDNLIKQYTNCYYKGKNLVCDSSFGTNNNLRMYSNYSYDKDDNLIKQTIYNPDGNINSQGIYYYNSNQDMIKSITKVPKTADVVYTFTYQYDSQGNWIQKITSLNGEVILLTIRQIEYSDN